MTFVNIGLFPDFRNDDTILVAADQAGILALAQLFRAASQPASGPIALTSLPFVRVFGNLDLMLRHSPHDLGIENSLVSAHAFTWSRDCEGWLEVAEKLDVLVDASNAHAYLNAAHRTDPVAVMASIGEYDAIWWHDHGSSIPVK